MNDGRCIREGKRLSHKLPAGANAVNSPGAAMKRSHRAPSPNASLAHSRVGFRASAFGHLAVVCGDTESVRHRERLCISASRGHGFQPPDPGETGSPLRAVLGALVLLVFLASQQLRHHAPTRSSPRQAGRPPRRLPNACRVPAYRCRQNSSCVPNSTTRLGGMLKNSVAERALRDMRTNSFFRHPIIPPLSRRGIRRSRPR